MELDELKTAWLQTNSVVAKSLKLNERIVEITRTQKVSTNLRPLYWYRVAELTAHLAAIGLLLFFLAHNFTELPYAASAVMLLAMYTVLAAGALKQINYITRIDYGLDLVTQQRLLESLQTHIISYSRLAVLFIPAFLAYPVVVGKVINDYQIRIWNDFDIMRQSNGQWWNVQIISAIVLVPLGIWFYRQVSFRNIDKPWVRKFIEKMTSIRVAGSLQFLKELEKVDQ